MGMTCKERTLGHHLGGDSRPPTTFEVFPTLHIHSQNGQDYEQFARTWNKSGSSHGFVNKRELISHPLPAIWTEPRSYLSM